MKLYEFDDAIEALVQEIATLEAVGELEASESNKKLLDTLYENRDEKIKNCIGYLKQIRANEAVIEQEINRLDVKKKSLEKQYEWLKNYIAVSLEYTPLKTPLDSVSYGTAYFAEPESSDSVPPSQYTEVRQEVVFKKRELLEDLKNKKVVPGWKLGVKKTVIIK